jgi:phage tail sheath gpL-like
MGIVTIPGFPTSDPEPGVHVFGELGQGEGSSGEAPLRVLLASQKVSMPSAQGSATDGVISRISSLEDSATKWGYGSGINHMYDALVAGCPTIEAHGCSVPVGAGSPLQGTRVLTFGGGPATTSGSVTMQVAGKNFEAALASGSTATQVAAALSALIGEGLTGGTVSNYTGIPVYASASSGALTLKSKWKSADVNDIGFATLITGLDGITLDVAAGFLTSGAIESDWDTLWDALEDETTQFDYVLLCSNDATAMTVGVDSAKVVIKALRRPDGGFKLLKAIFGSNDSEANAHIFASDWEEGTAVDETGGFGQIWCGLGQTAPPWIVGAACAGIRLNAESEKVNKNPCSWGGTEVPYLPVPLSKTSWPTRSDIRAGLNEGVSMLSYDPARMVVLMTRSITCKHSTGGLTDYKARPTVIPVVIDYILKDIKARLESFYSDFFVASDDPVTHRPPRDLGPKTVTPYRYKKKVAKYLKEYEGEGLLEGADALAEAIVAERDTTVTSRLNADAGLQIRRWLEQLGLLLREVGGAA